MIDQLIYEMREIGSFAQSHLILSVIGIIGFMIFCEKCIPGPRRKCPICKQDMQLHRGTVSTAHYTCAKCGYKEGY